MKGRKVSMGISMEDVEICKKRLFTLYLQTLGN